MDMATKLQGQRAVIVQEEPPSWMTDGFSESEQRVIQSAYAFGRRVHAHERYQDGALYFSHLVEVARTCIVEVKIRDAGLIIDILLCNVRNVETPKQIGHITPKRLQSLFGKERELDIHALTRKKQGGRKKEAKSVWIGRIVNQGWRTLLVWLLRSIDDLRTIDCCDPERQVQAYQEVVEYYHPLLIDLKEMFPEGMKYHILNVESGLEQALDHAHQVITSDPRGAGVL